MKLRPQDPHRESQGWHCALKSQGFQVGWRVDQCLGKWVGIVARAAEGGCSKVKEEFANNWVSASRDGSREAHQSGGCCARMPPGTTVLTGMRPSRGGVRGPRSGERGWCAHPQAELQPWTFRRGSLEVVGRFYTHPACVVSLQEGCLRTLQGSLEHDICSGLARPRGWHLR